MLNFWALKISRKEDKFAGSFLIAELGGRELWDLRTLWGNFQIVLKSQNKSLLKSSHPKEYLPNSTTQKNPGIENFKPKKILWSSLSLEIRSTPPPPPPSNPLGVFGSFWSENGYRLCLSGKFRGNYGSVWTYSSFQFQMIKKERKICKFEIDFGCCSNISNDDSISYRPGLQTV